MIVYSVKDIIDAIVKSNPFKNRGPGTVSQKN